MLDLFNQVYELFQDGRLFKYRPCIPAFMEKLFRLKFGYTLLIKGSPGTGKTTLAMEVLLEKKEDFNLIYVSTGTNVKALRSQYPWFTDEMEEGALQDLKTIEIQSRTIKVHDFDSMGFPNAFFNLEDTIQELQAKNDKKTIMVIDSVNKLAEVISSRGQGFPLDKIFEGLVNMARKLEIKLLMVYEGTEITNFDYLVDGIVTMIRDTQTIKDKVFRFIRIEKLRHVQVDKHQMVFSLQWGRYFSFEAPNPVFSLYPLEKRFKAVHDYFVGNRRVLAAFSELLRVKRLMIDFSHECNELLNFLLIFYINLCLLGGYNLFIINFPGINVNTLCRTLESTYGRKFVESRVCIGFVPHHFNNKVELPSYVLPSRSEDFFEELQAARYAIENFANNVEYKGTAFILPLDHVYQNYDKENPTRLFQFLFQEKILRNEDNLVVSNVSFNYMEPGHVQLVESFSARILFILKALMVANTPVMYWLKLPRPAFGVFPRFATRDDGLELERMDFIPIK